MNLDPYAPPSTLAETNSPTAPALNPRDLSARKIVTSWEKLRLYFNLILLLPGIGILISVKLPLSGAAAAGLFSGFMANLCFFLGPLTELYACAIISKPEAPNLRFILFTLGIVGSLFIFASIYLEIYS